MIVAFQFGKAMGGLLGITGRMAAELGGQENSRELLPNKPDS
jgi:hypothetical protein